jgi:hypothetical protein
MKGSEYSPLIGRWFAARPQMFYGVRIGQDVMVANSEGPNSEDGAGEIGIIDVEQHGLVARVL